MRALILITAVALVGCADSLAQRALYPFDAVNKAHPSTEVIKHYPNQSGPVIFYLHGNGENIAAIEPNLVPALNHYGYVTVPEYPGLGPLAGPANQAVIMNAVINRFREAKADWHGTGRRIFVIGRSLGAAVAAQLAAEGPDGILLISPWTTAKDAGRAQSIGFLTALVSEKFWAANTWDTLSAVRKFSGPLAVIHGSADKLIPHSQGAAVAAAAGAKLVTTDAGHNDIFSKSETWAGIRNFLTGGDNVFYSDL